MIIDLRSAQKPQDDFHTFTHGTVLVRDPADITGIVFHQTACVYGVSAMQVREANGDRVLAKQRRALNVRAHAVAFRDVGVVLPNPFLWQVEHANRLNPYSLGLEAEAFVEGIDGDYRTFPGAEHRRAPATDQLIETTRRAFEALVQRSAEEKIDIRYVWAHRQSNPSRRADPGERLWKSCVLEYAVPKLGLQTQPDAIWPYRGSHGRPIPEAWDPTRKGVMY